MNDWHSNLLAAWIGIVLGFASGAVMGMYFRDEKWLGGYGSFKRRLYRLGHISFFGLALMNLAFYLTARTFSGPSLVLSTASWAFLVGSVSMPVCCVLMAHRPRVLAIFTVPVASLLLGSVLVLTATMQEASDRSKPVIGAQKSTNFLRK